MKIAKYLTPLLAVCLLAACAPSEITYPTNYEGTITYINDGSEDAMKLFNGINYDSFSIDIKEIDKTSFLQAGSVNVFAESKYYYSDCSLHYTEQDIEKVYFYSINFHLVSTELADAIITLRTLVSNDVTKVCGGSLSVSFLLTIQSLTLNATHTFTLLDTYRTTNKEFKPIMTFGLQYLGEYQYDVVDSISLTGTFK